MASLQTLRERCTTILGMTCLMATLLLLSTGVRAVRADDGEAGPLTSTDPALVEAQQGMPNGAAPVAGAPAPPVASPADGVERNRRPGAPAVEVAPGVVVLNTRGFNYGPPPAELDPAALKAETLQK